jgi:hypothetical protein
VVESEVVCTAPKGWRPVDMWLVCMSRGAALGERRDHFVDPSDAHFLRTL